MGPVMATTIVCSTKGSQNKGGYHNIFTTRILYTHSNYVQKNKNEGLGFKFFFSKMKIKIVQIYM